MKDFKIGIIGGGAMGGSLARGLMNKQALSPAQIIISNPHLEKLSDLKEMGVEITMDNRKVAESCNLLVICVKPWKIEEVIKNISSFINKETEVALVVAGIQSGDLLKMFSQKEPDSLSIVMPNTAMIKGESMTFIVPLKGDCKEAKEIFSYVGKVKEIEERLLPAATALASCGIAYALRYVRAAVEGGVELGFSAKEGQGIIVQTLAGAISLLREQGSHAEAEIDKVTTPGGITIKGLNTMEKYGFTTAVIEGLKASRK